MRERVIIILLVCAWVVAVAASFLLAWQIEGGRNIDTGFKRLDVFFKWQVGAFLIAVFLAGVGLLGKSLQRWLRWIAGAPILLTLATVCLFVGYAYFVGGPPGSTPDPSQRTQTAPSTVAD
ncbi:MAG: hypothetical protein AAF479_07640 [Pseudomonadota bacterium]